MGSTSRKWRARDVCYSSITFVFLMEVINAQQLENPSFCFSMDKFELNQPNLIFQYDASVSATGALELTKKVNQEPASGSVGRVLYSVPFKIWDRKTYRATSFVTSFSFIVKAPLNKRSADGIAFFIAPNSQFPLASDGGLLGIFSNSYNDSTRQTVAVEFDTCFNTLWDKIYPYHIGIDVNSIQSVKAVKWRMRNGEIANAVIAYSADINLLNISLSYSEVPQLTDCLNYSIDLKKIVPEWVSIGISATVGTSPDSAESHDLLSWSFRTF